MRTRSRHTEMIDIIYRNGTFYKVDFDNKENTELSCSAISRGGFFMRNVRRRSKEGLSLTDIKVGVPVGASAYFLVLMFLFFIVLPDRVIASDFNPKHLYEEVSQSIVAVTGADSKSSRRSIGAGSIIHKDGLILTNAHIIFNKET